MSLIKNYKDFNEFFKEKLQAIKIARGNSTIISVSCLFKTDDKKIYESATSINGAIVLTSFDRKTKRGFVMVDGVSI